MIYPSSNKKSDDFIGVRLTMRVNAHRNVDLNYTYSIHNTNTMYHELCIRIVGFEPTTFGL